MALTHSVTQQAAIANGIATALGASFEVQIVTTSNGIGGTVLATLTHAAGIPTTTATDTVDLYSNGGIADDTNAVAGTAAGFRLTTSGDAATVLSGTVQTDGITLSSTSIGAGDTVSISALTYQAPT